MSKETSVCQKRLLYVKRDFCMSKETSVCQKRPLKRDFICLVNVICESLYVICLVKDSSHMSCERL